MIEVYSLRERTQWLDHWRRTGREPFAHPDFVALFGTPSAEPIAVRHQQRHGSVLLPLLRRRLPDELLTGRTDLETPWTDAVSPYGYGGPFIEGRVDWADFYGALLEWLREVDVVSCFVRASLGLDHSAARDVPGCEAATLGENIWVDLTREPEEQLRHYAHKVRKNVRKARAAGLSVDVRSHEVDVPELVEVYLETMERKGADQRYRFDETFFRKVLAVPGGSVVAEVRDRSGVLVSTEVVLTSDHSLYSFLGGTRREYFPHAPNDLLKTAVVDFGHRTGRRRFVLGGGLEPGDGIFQYKKAFDTDGVVPFVGLRLVPDHDRYEILCDAVGMVADRREAADYFPAYRTGRPTSVV